MSYHRQSQGKPKIGCFPTSERARGQNPLRPMVTKFYPKKISSWLTNVCHGVHKAPKSASSDSAQCAQVESNESEKYIAGTFAGW